MSVNFAESMSRLLSAGLEISSGLLFLLVTIIVSKLVFAVFSMGIRNARLILVIVLVQFAVLPPRVLVYALFAYGFFYPIHPVVALVCSAAVFCAMAIVEWQLYQQVGATQKPAMLSLALNVAYLVVLVSFCVYTRYIPLPIGVLP